jgi:hypothetical protein
MIIIYGYWVQGDDVGMKQLVQCVCKLDVVLHSALLHPHEYAVSEGSFVLENVEVNQSVVCWIMLSVVHCLKINLTTAIIFA